MNRRTIRKGGGGWGGCKTRQNLKSFVVVSFVDGSMDLVDHFGKEKFLINHTCKNSTDTIQLYCLCVEKFAFWLVIYIKTFNKINNKTSTAQ